MRKSKKENLNEIDILLEIKRLNQALKLDFDKRLLQFDLTSQQARCLVFVYKSTNEGKIIHQNDVQKRFDLSKSTVSGLINRLLKKELLKKECEKSYSILTVTEKGEAIIEQIYEFRSQTITKLLAGFKKKEQIEINYLINRLINNMKEED